MQTWRTLNIRFPSNSQTVTCTCGENYRQPYFHSTNKDGVHELLSGRAKDHWTRASHGTNGRPFSTNLGMKPKKTPSFHLHLRLTTSLAVGPMCKTVRVLLLKEMTRLGSIVWNLPHDWRFGSNPCLLVLLTDLHVFLPLQVLYLPVPWRWWWHLLCLLLLISH